MLLTLVLVTGCGKSSSSSSTPATTTTTTASKIGGTVFAPNGSLAKLQTKTLWAKIASFFVSESVAQSTPALVAVAGTNILVFNIDNAGNPVGSPIATGTTDATGAYSVTLPTGTTLGSNLIVQASPTTTPANVTNNTRINCPAVAPPSSTGVVTLNLNPAAQLATTVIIAQIQASGASGALANFTNAETAAFINLIQTFSQDPSLVGTDIATTVANIKTKLQKLIDTTLPAIAAPGEVPPVATLGGTYNFLSFETSISVGGFRRGVLSGSVTIDPSAKTFSFTGTNNSVNLSEACGTSGNVCERVFTKTTDLGRSESTSGAITLAGNGQIYFVEDKKPNGDGGGTTLGLMNPAGTLIVLPFIEAGGDLGLGVAVKQGSNLSTATVDGKTFNFSQFGSDMNATSGVGSWSGFTDKLSSGTVAFAGATFSGSETKNRMQPQISCTALQGGGCNLSGTVFESSDTKTVGGTYTVSPNGAATFTTNEPGANGNPGVISSDGNFALIAGGSPADGNLNVIIGILQGSGMTTASLNGTYNIADIKDEFEAGQSASVGTRINTGSITFDGAGKFTVSGTGTGVRRSEGCPGGQTQTTCPSIRLEGGTDTFSTSGTYTITATGEITISGTDQDCVNRGGSQCTFSIPGTVSADQSVVMFRHTESGNCGQGCGKASRDLIFGIKQ